MQPVIANGIYLEDIRVGDVFESEVHQLDAEQIVQFASQFDPQPFHLGDAASKDTFFDGLVASGWHTMAVTMRLIVRSVPFAHGIIGAGGEIAWPQPTRPTDALRVRSSIASITPSRSKPDRATVVVECVTSNQDGAVLQKLTARLIAFKKSS
jgi:acyl dehydratase